MHTDDARAILEKLAQGTMTMDEADAALASLDDPDPLTAEPAGPAATRVLPAADPTSAVVVRIAINSSSEIEIVGDPRVVAPYLDGPHSAEVRDDNGAFAVEGRMGDDSLLVVPADVDLAIEANSPSLTLRGVGGSLDARINAGDVDIRAAFTRGQSRIDANAGDLRIGLHADSNVRIQIRSATSVSPSGEFIKTGRGVWTYGDGDAELAISGNIGRVVLYRQVEVEAGDRDFTGATTR
jgi:hypothetical protein